MKKYLIAKENISAFCIEGKAKLFFFLVAVLAILIFPPVTLAANVMHWSTLAPMPAPLAGRYSGVDTNGRIYLISGVTASGTPVGTVDVYDPVSNVWNPPGVQHASTVALDKACSVQVGNMVYMIGGKDSSGTVLGKVYEYDMGTGASAWIGNLQVPRYACRAVYAPAANKIYVIGGQNASNAFLDSIIEYDVSSGLSQPVAQMKYPVRFPMVFEYGGKVYIYGGNDGTNLHAEGWELDPNAVGPYTPNPGVAINLTPTPYMLTTPRQGPPCVKLPNGLLYAAGGNDGSPTNVVQEYDPNPGSMSWSIIGSMPTARVAMALQAVGNRLYVFGGKDAGVYLDKTEVGQLVTPTGTGYNTVPGQGTTSVTVGSNPPVDIIMPGGTTSGEVWVNTLSTLPVGLPGGFRLQGSFWDIATSADYNGGTITIRVPFTMPLQNGTPDNSGCPSLTPFSQGYTTNPNPNPNNCRPKLFHWNGTAWQNITTYVDTTGLYVEGQTNSLSPFAVAVESSATAVGYNPQWLIITLVSLTIAGGFLLRRRQRT